MPSHNYTYTFEPSSKFTSVLSGHDEIRGYFNDFADKYDLRRHVRTSQRVTSTSWDPVEGRWNVTVADQTSSSSPSNGEQQQQEGEEKEVVREDWCHILIHATGYLNKPAWPKAPGLETFKGPKLHSAMWDDTVDLAGKDVVLIGSGGSGVQILPAIQPIVRSAKAFVRTPRWALPSVNAKSGKFSDEDMQRFASDPGAVTEVRLQNERTLNSFFSRFLLFLFPPLTPLPLLLPREHIRESFVMPRISLLTFLGKQQCT